MSSVGRGRNAGPEPPESTPALIWHFARAVLDERTMELRVDGKPVALEPKPLELLRELLRHAGEVVTKEELADAVWPGRIISESNLTKCISTVRDAVGDEQQAIVKTVHGYGYRLAALVRIEEAASAAAPGRFAFEPGSQPPRRPDWRLEQKLGSGGHGEVWLARHVSSGESRVFKFAGDGA